MHNDATAMPSEHSCQPGNGGSGRLLLSLISVSVIALTIAGVAIAAQIVVLAVLTRLEVEQKRALRGEHDSPTTADTGAASTPA
jgi:hypothetical protein